MRTPFTRAHKGEFKDTRPDTLAALAIKEAVAQVPGLKPEEVEDVILGCAMPEAEQGMNVARNAALLAGLPDTVPGDDRQPLLLVGHAVHRHGGAGHQGGDDPGRHRPVAPSP